MAERQSMDWPPMDAYAFPWQAPDGHVCVGMTLRDYFAARALPSCIGHSPTVDAARAYEYADAMLAARG